MRIQILILRLKGSNIFKMKLDSLQIAFCWFLNECIIYLSQFLWCTWDEKFEFLRYKRNTIKCHILVYSFLMMES